MKKIRKAVIGSRQAEKHESFSLLPRPIGACHSCIAIERVAHETRHHTSDKIKRGAIHIGNGLELLLVVVLQADSATHSQEVPTSNPEQDA